METKIAEKVLRFLELSLKFSKTVDEVFPRPKNENVIYGGSISLPSSGTNISDRKWILNGRELYTDKDGTVKASDGKPTTRGEKMMAEAKAKAEVSDEYDEYLLLQWDLKDYFFSLLNIVK